MTADPPAIIVTGDSPLAHVAADELRLAFARLDSAPPIARIELRAGNTPDGEGFRWRTDGDTVRIEGDGPRGVLHGAFDVLEALGFAWPGPGESAAVIPHVPEFAVTQRAETPALAGRSLIVGHHAVMAEAADWIVWAARNRLNTIFFHVDEHGLGLGAIPAAQWRKTSEAAIALARRYGMTLEFGGHGLPYLLPRGEAETHPDWYPVRGGKPDPRHNINPLSEDALGLVRRNARAWFEANPGFDVYHLWADDLPDGGWCEAAAAQGHSPSDQLMLVTNAVADELAEVAPAASLAFLSYHDTEAPPRIAPRSNVSLTFAPRLRCYAAAIDAAHPVNDKYPELWRANAALFPGPHRVRVFEYWLDAILFKIVAPPMVEVIARDLAFYAANGAHTVGVLLTGSMPLVAPNLNAYAFARLAWNPALSPKSVRAAFCEQVFDSALHMPAYFEHLERAFAADLDLRPAEARLKGRGSLEETLDDPPADIGSPFNIADDDLADARTNQNAALDALAEAETVFDAMFRAADDPSPAIMDEECHRYLCHARLTLQSAVMEVRAEQAIGGADYIQAAIRASRSMLTDLEKQTRGFTRDPYVANTRLLLWLFLGLALDKAEDDLIAGDSARRKRRRNRLETARQNFARLGGLWTS